MCFASSAMSNSGVSIHAPAWGATPAWMPITAPNGSFNPRTRVGCDQRPGHRQRGSGAVSIHAPAWGATPPRPLFFSLRRVSIHAPAWGATIRLRVCSFWPAMFQSTHPRGVRRFWSCFPFNSSLFQSTHPRGVRLRSRDSAWHLSSFNPRTRVGCDSPGRTS